MAAGEGRPRAKLSPPKKQLIWYVEENVPVEYRPFVQEGILEWNKAFEKIGFRDALAVRWAENGRDDFDPEDTNYCTFRWIATNSTFAMSALRANPLTGEMIDGDVIFDESWIRAWKQEYALLTGSPLPTGRDDENRRVLDIGEIISPILAAKQGYGLLNPPAGSRLATQANQSGGMELVPSGWSEIQLKLAPAHGPGRGLPVCRRHASRDGADGPGPGRRGQGRGRRQAPRGVDRPGHQGSRDARGRPLARPAAQLQGQHHAPADQLNDTAITRTKGLVGSVMDYNPINIAPKGKKQGDYFTTTIGPYDYWAIEYAYKPISGDEDGELKKIASRAPEHDLAFATDGDLYGNDDPTVNLYDLGADPCQFAKDRIALASELIKDLDAKAIRDGESWVRVREAFSILLSQFGNGAAWSARTSAASRSTATARATRTPATRSSPPRGPSSARPWASWSRTSSATSRSSSRRPCSAASAPRSGTTGARTPRCRASSIRSTTACWASRRSHCRSASTPACSGGSRTRRSRPTPPPTRSRCPRSSAP